MGSGSGRGCRGLWIEQGRRGSLVEELGFRAGWLGAGVGAGSAWRVWRGGLGWGRGGLVVGCAFVAEVDVGWFGVFGVED